MSVTLTVVEYNDRRRVSEHATVSEAISVAVKTPVRRKTARSFITSEDGKRSIVVVTDGQVYHVERDVRRFVEHSWTENSVHTDNARGIR